MVVFNSLLSRQTERTTLVFHYNDGWSGYVHSNALMLALACTLAGPGACYEHSMIKTKGRGW